MNPFFANSGTLDLVDQGGFDDLEEQNLSVLASAPRAIRTRSRLRVHIGSAEVLARVRVLNLRGYKQQRDASVPRLTVGSCELMP